MNTIHLNGVCVCVCVCHALHVVHVAGILIEFLSWHKQKSSAITLCRIFHLNISNWCHEMQCYINTRIYTHFLFYFFHFHKNYRLWHIHHTFEDMHYDFCDFIWQMNDHAICRNACHFMATMKNKTFFRLHSFLILDG